MRNGLKHNLDNFGAGRAWYVFLALAALSLFCAAILDKQFVQRWVISSANGSTALAHITLFRYGLCALAGLFTTGWLLRKILSKDWFFAGSRWQRPPAHLSPFGLLPVVNPRPLRSILVVFVPLWTVGVGFSLLVDDAWANRLTRENAALQAATVIFYIFSGILLLTRSISYFHRDNPQGLRRWWILLLALFCFFVAGEETKWGQTYFHYDTPQVFKQLNVQGDFSLHNTRIPKGMMRDYWANDFSQYLSILAGVVFPVLLLTFSGFRRLIWNLDVPLPPWLAQAYFFIAAVIPPDKLLMSQMSRANIPSELRELTLAMAFAIWSWSCWRNKKQNTEENPSGGNI